MSKLSDTIREQFGDGDKIRDAGLTSPYTITRCDNIAYGSDEMQVLDVYYPKGTLKKLPIIISVHGGGWVYGSKEVYQYYGMFLASLGFAVINFSYRLAPEHKFPSSIEDTNSVVKWMFDHENEYPFDLKHVFMVGDSAGAAMLGIYSNICTNNKYANNYSFEVPNGFIPTAIALNCGGYAKRSKDKGDDAFEGLSKEYLVDETQLSLTYVVDYMKDNFPPTYLMSSTGDFLLAQYPFMKEKLEELNIKHIGKIYGDEKNQLPHVFHCNVKTEDAAICNQEECEFFRQFL